MKWISYINNSFKKKEEEKVMHAHGEENYIRKWIMYKLARKTKMITKQNEKRRI